MATEEEVREILEEVEIYLTILFEVAWVLEFERPRDGLAVR